MNVIWIKVLFLENTCLYNKNSKIHKLSKNKSFWRSSRMVFVFCVENFKCYSTECSPNLTSRFYLIIYSRIVTFSFKNINNSQEGIQWPLQDRPLDISILNAIIFLIFIVAKKWKSPHTHTKFKNNSYFGSMNYRPFNSDDFSNIS